MSPLLFLMLLQADTDMLSCESLTDFLINFAMCISIYFWKSLPTSRLFKSSVFFFVGIVEYNLGLIKYSVEEFFI